MQACRSGSSGSVPSARIHSRWVGSLPPPWMNGRPPMWRWSIGWGRANQSPTLSRKCSSRTARVSSVSGSGTSGMGNWWDSPTSSAWNEADMLKMARPCWMATTRRVVALQHGRAIFNMSASFHADEVGLSHQFPMPDVPDPETLETLAVRLEPYRESIGDWFARPHPIDQRHIGGLPFIHGGGKEPTQRLWIRADGTLPDDPLLHACIAAYASDMSLFDTMLAPHDVSWDDPEFMGASLDHCMWFHRPFRADDWLLYDMDSPSAYGARGLARGFMFAGNGDRVASMVQEGLMRKGPGPGVSWAASGRATRWSAVGDGHVVPLGFSYVELPRAGDLRVLIEHLLPVGEPARRPGNGEQHGEHLERKPHGLVDEARVEVDVGVEPAGDEVLVGEGDLLELQGDVQQRVLAGDLEHLVGGLLDDLGPRVVALVDPVAEPLQPYTRALLDRGDERLDVLERTDVGQHPDDRLVGPPVPGPVERGSSGSGGRVGVGMRRAHHPHGGGRAVLLMIGVEDEQDVEGASQGRIGIEPRLGGFPHHGQEIGGEFQRVVRIDEGHAHAEPVGGCRQSGHLGDQADDLLVPRLDVEDVLGVEVEGGERSHRRNQHSHGMGVVVEPLEEALPHVFVNERVMGDLVLPDVVLGRARQLALQQEIGDFEEGRLLGQLLDRIAPVAEDPLVAVEEGDRTLARRRRHEARVVEPDAGEELPPLGCRDPPVLKGNLEGLTGPVVGDRDAFGHSPQNLPLVSSLIAGPNPRSSPPDPDQLAQRHAPRTGTHPTSGGRWGRFPTERRPTRSTGYLEEILLGGPGGVRLPGGCGDRNGQ